MTAAKLNARAHQRGPPIPPFQFSIRMAGFCRGCFTCATPAREPVRPLAKFEWNQSVHTDRQEGGRFRSFAMSVAVSPASITFDRPALLRLGVSIGLAAVAGLLLTAG